MDKNISGIRRGGLMTRFALFAGLMAAFAKSNKGKQVDPSKIPTLKGIGKYRTKRSTGTNQRKIRKARRQVPQLLRSKKHRRHA